MKKIVYLFMLISLWACENKQEKELERQLIESSYPLLEEQKECFQLLHSHILTLYAEKGKPHKADTITLYQHLIYQDNFNADSLFHVAKFLEKEHQLNISWLSNKDSLSSTFHANYDTTQAKEVLLHQLRKLNHSIAFFKEIKQSILAKTPYNQYKYTMEQTQEYELLTQFDKSKYQVGDTLQVSFHFAQDLASKTLKSPILIKVPKDTSFYSETSEFSIIAKNNTTIQQRKRVGIINPLLDSTGLFFSTYYYVLP